MFRTTESGNPDDGEPLCMRFSLLWHREAKKHTGLLIVVCLLDGRFNGRTAEPLKVSIA